MTVNQRVRHLRKEVLHLTQADFGAVLHLRQQAIGMMETQTGITNRNIAAICEHWNVREEWLRDGTGEIFVASTVLTDPDALRKQVLNAYAAMSSDRRARFLMLFEQVAK